MSTRALLLAGVLAAACGQAEPTLSTAVVLSGFHDTVNGLRIFAFGPRTTDDILLACTALESQIILSTDDRLERLAWIDVNLDGEDEFLLEAVTAGEGRVVFVEAYDGGTLLGVGCEEGVEVKEGETTEVTVVVRPL